MTKHVNAITEFGHLVVDGDDLGVMPGWALVIENVTQWKPGHGVKLVIVGRTNIQFDLENVFISWPDFPDIAPVGADPLKVPA